MSGVRAEAAVVAERRPGGATRCTTLRSDPPLTLRATAPGTVHLVGSAAGPLGGDALRLDVRVGQAAALRIRSVAASVVQPGPSARSSTADVTVAVGPGASLSWAPEPTIVVRGCDHRAGVRAHLAGDARLWWQEAVVLGRHRERPGSLLQRFRVDVDGRPLVRNDLAVGPRWPASQGPAGVGDHRVLATALVVAPSAGDVGGSLPSPTGARAAVMPFGDDAALVTVVAHEVDAVAAVLAQAANDWGRLAGRDSAACRGGADGAVFTAESDEWRGEYSYSIRRS